MEGSKTPVSATADILEAAREFVLATFNEQGDARLVFHHYQRGLELTQSIDEIGRGPELSPKVLEHSLLAGWLEATGYLSDYGQPLEGALRSARRFFARQDYPEEDRETVLRCLREAHSASPPVLAAARLLNDAIVITDFVRDWAGRSPLLRLESELMTDRSYDKLAWAKLDLQRLLQARLYTHRAKSQYEHLLARTIADQRNRITKEERKAQLQQLPGDRPFESFEVDPPSRAIQTFFRANYRNHINLSSIADNKANIMISVNSILISVLITILTYRNITETEPQVLLPAVIFLVTALASLIFAILSARPKVTRLNGEQTSTSDIRRNIVFFGNFVHLDLEEYETAMDAVFRNGELLYGNLTRDLYFLGKVLEKKYRYLTVSYNIFMVGFVITVGVFLFIYFT